MANSGDDPLPHPPIDEEAPETIPSIHPGAPPPRFATPNHARTAKFLYDAASSGRLGSGPVEPDPDKQHFFKMLFKTIPWIMLLVQLAWSCLVVFVGRIIQDRSGTSLSVSYWSSKINVSSSISYGVGWALFVLLGFFIREASARYNEAQTSLEKVSGLLRQTLRKIRLLYPVNAWHSGDLDRMAAHLVAYPIALKMTLRKEREREQLESILHPDDLSDVLSADLMHAHCSRVLRAYLISIEDDAPDLFTHTSVSSTPLGYGTRYFILDLLDGVDLAANAAVRIAEFRPSLGYVNHLRIFMCIWFFFLPLSLIETSGWFTILWAILITYGIGMLFTIASALNEPYGHDLQDVKLNRLCSRIAFDVLVDYSSSKLSMADTVRNDHETPRWLEEPVVMDEDPEKNVSFAKKAFSVYRSIVRSIFSPPPLLISLFVFTLWISFIVFLTWGLTRNDDPSRASGDRWWTIYLPVSTGTTGYVSLGIFLLLGFWMNDAYGRYWRGLLLWQTKLKANMELIAYRIIMTCNDGLWHSRDRERLFSHIVALPFVTKSFLRTSRDLTDVEPLLDAKDLQLLAEAPNMPDHCLAVIHSYIDKIDGSDGNCPFRTLVYPLLYGLWEVENVIIECDSMRKYKISPSFTIHLRLFVFFWLALLPISLVSNDGFLSFLYLLPICYSIVNILIIGSNLADPFGDDEEDIPLDDLCNDLKKKIHVMYYEAKDGTASYIKHEEYKREWFIPNNLDKAPRSKVVDEGSTTMEGTVTTETIPLANGSKDIEPEKEERPFTERPTFRGFLKIFFKYLPNVSLTAQIIATMWTVCAVFLSFGLSKLWKDQKRGSCNWWCSPIDVNGTVLSNIGFALFMILSFRASDAIGRYEEGAEMIYDIEMNLRNLAIEIVSTYPPGLYHKGDVERLIAHLVQIPLCIRDKLLEIDRSDPASREGLLTEEDYSRFLSSSDPFEYLIRTVDAYLLMEDKSDRSSLSDPSFTTPGFMRALKMNRLRTIQTTYLRVMSVKTFPVIPSYSKHQHLFTALWLALLPLSMTQQTGFFTILWAPLVSYGVFGLESIAAKLVDPYGNDSIDIPVDKLLTDASNEVLESVNSCGWDSYNFTGESLLNTEPRLGTILRGDQVLGAHVLAYFEDHEATPDNFGKSPAIKFDAGHPKAMKATLLAHIVRSVPWWVLAMVTIWTGAACVISYVTRDKDEEGVRWWKSSISVSPSVATYVSFAAFMLLGFYVQAAFKRYHEAGSVWADNLRASCHAMAVQMQGLIEDGVLHEGDKDRIFGHIAAIPLVFKHELRSSRDIREVKGLLSMADVARIQTSASMIVHCQDVIRAYLTELCTHSERHRNKSFKDYARTSFFSLDLVGLEKALRSCKFLNQFEIAPGFLILLNCLLGLWFLLLPFVLAEVSGWFTILWVPIIAYGLLGMYAIASELQGPFGYDLNDLDMDEIADSIVHDILFVQKHHKGGFKVLVRPSKVAEMWVTTDITAELPRTSLFKDEEDTAWVRFKTAVVLAYRAVPLWQMLLVVLWSTLSVLLAWGVSKWFKVDTCDSVWFCSYIAVDDSVKEFIGFALFLLLGFRLYDSHYRYVSALQIWQDGVIGISRLLSNRFLHSYKPGIWHEGDLARICGHLAAFAICLMCMLRDENPEEKLLKVLGPDDVKRIISTKERTDYCIDVLRSYLLYMEDRLADSEKPVSVCEHWLTVWYVRVLSGTAHECQRMVRIPLPFGYVQHLRIFLIIWLLLLPLGLVEDTGWLTILWVTLIAYGVLGIEHWSQELSDPFGYDLSDVPLDELCDRVVGVVMNNVSAFREQRASSFIRTDRGSFGGYVGDVGDAHDVGAVGVESAVGGEGDVSAVGPVKKADDGDGFGGVDG